MPLFGGVGGEPERVAQLSPRRRRLYLDQKSPFWGGNFLFLERGQFGVALNELVDGLQEACVHLGRKESRLTIRA
jgi:hypothetical protein